MLDTSPIGVRTEPSVLLVLSLLLQILLIPPLLTGSASAEVLTEFGMAGGPESVNISFSGPGHDLSTNVSLGQSTIVSTATLDVRGWPNATGSSPTTIAVDVGDDGDLEWGFGGPGNGSFGHVTELSNGLDRAALNLSTGHNDSYSLRLPADAVVTSATFDFATLSELSLSGADARDSYLHQPNPTWGNATYKDCNYGTTAVTVVGKTQWSNWHIYRGVYWFDLSALPGATVLSAELQLYVEDVVDNANTGQPVTTQQTYTLYPLLKDWEEGLEDDVPVQQGPGVTWYKAIDNLTGPDYSWSTAGAGSTTQDHGAAVDSITESPANMEGTWIAFNSTGMLNLVQGWVDGSSANQGLLLLGNENTNKPQGSMITLTARQNASHGPRLVIVFAGEDDVSAGLDVDDDGIEEWSHAGNLSSGSSTADLSAALNSYLAAAIPTFIDDYGNAFVDIPLNVSGNATLVLENIDVRYDWTPSIGASPHGTLAAELNDHIASLLPDSSGNVSIPFNVTSGSAGIVELSNLQIGIGDRPPTVGSIILPLDVVVPDGQQITIGAEVTSYQGVANLSWVTLTPQLINASARPVFHYSFPLSVASVTDPAGLVTNSSGSMQALNGDTAEVLWNFSSSWNWEPELGVSWLVEVSTVDALLFTRLSTQTTDHERRMEITSFSVFDETEPTEGAPEVQEMEWIAGGDVLRISGEIEFLGSSRHPSPNDVMVELINVSGNGTVDSNGFFDISSQAPLQDHPNGFTIGARLRGAYDATPAQTAQRTLLIDGTPPGILVNAPLGQRVQPDHQNLFNVSIADSIGLPDILTFRWWVEGLHDDGDGVPEANEYATKALMRQQDTEFFHATFDDTSNLQGWWVSLYIEGADEVGNAVDGGAPGFEDDLLHFSSLVPVPTTLVTSSLEFPGGQTLVPSHPGWLNFSLLDANGVEDIESFTLDLGQGSLLDWNAASGNLISNDIELSGEGFSLIGEGENISLSISLVATPWFDPASSSGQITLSVTDSSGTQSLSTGLEWEFDTDIWISDFSVSTTVAAHGIQLQDDSWVMLGGYIVFSGSVQYIAAGAPPPDYCYEARLEAPLGNPIPLAAGGDGSLNGTLEAQSNGLYQIVLSSLCGTSQVRPATDSIQLRVDSEAPLLVGSQPALVAANSTVMLLELDIREADSGLASGEVEITCQARRGLDSVGAEFDTPATEFVSGDVSRYRAELSFEALEHGDVLECWLDLYDIAGNHLTGEGSSLTWPLQFPVVELRPDLVLHRFSTDPDPAIGGEPALVNITIANLGEVTDEQFTVSMWILDEEVGNRSVRFLEGESRIELSFSWRPDWVGELDIIVILDPEGALDEQDESNTWTFSIEVENAPSQSVFASGTLLIAASALALLLAVIGLLLLIRYLIRDDDEYEDWEEEDVAEQQASSAPPGEVRRWQDEDGHEWRELSDGSREWWEESSRSWRL